MAFTLRLSTGFRALPRHVSWLYTPHRARFPRADKGTAAVEFAIIGPVLVVFLMGIVTYGSYFLAAHTVQQLANDAARAVIAGLDDGERTQIATQTVNEGIAEQTYMRGALTAVQVTRNDTAISVRVSYDASPDVWTRLLVPAPSTTISRTATIRLGGY